MSFAQKKARLTWHCRRGMLELDLLLTRFMARHFDTLDPHQVEALEVLLGYSDPDLYALLMGHEQATDQGIADIVSFIRLQNHAEAFA